MYHNPALTNITRLITGTMTKETFSAMTFNDSGKDGNLARTFKNLILEGKEVNAENIWLSTKNTQILGYYRDLCNKNEKRTEVSPVPEGNPDDPINQKIEACRQVYLKMFEYQVGKSVDQVLEEHGRLRK